MKLQGSFRKQIVISQLEFSQDTTANTSVTFNQHPFNMHEVTFFYH